VLAPCMNLFTCPHAAAVHPRGIPFRANLLLALKQLLRTQGETPFKRAGVPKEVCIASSTAHPCLLLAPRADMQPLHAGARGHALAFQKQGPQESRRGNGGALAGVTIELVEEALVLLALRSALLGYINGCAFQGCGYQWSSWHRAIDDCLLNDKSILKAHVFKFHDSPGQLAGQRQLKESDVHGRRLQKL